mmetsp:Transcript_14340/g.29729  ORF Transcript_14340/g.29729 Transcript_14340/m.29729 type:complete len:127 (-) Transcript_14340:182-562(-)|eukprot:CAMPEP_0172471128 /NCGR_PEP_ID=MMETSP1065-20121228/67659_1 /TAXON_ID=265537 /ORGANISM="Amphiprora paludosa, Strain CCMP125" /LENGTH=126 /DNA_ID=CAMNT_0013229215 /DNA_START=30 /DNA_END=410 /DNA_ORIENTATION=+
MTTIKQEAAVMASSNSPSSRPARRFEDESGAVTRTTSAATLPTMSLLSLLQAPQQQRQEPQSAESFWSAPWLSMGHLDDNEEGTSLADILDQAMELADQVEDTQARSFWRLDSSGGSSWSGEPRGQ